MSNLIRECYPAESNHSDDPAEDGHSGVFDWIATCPSMVAHMFDTDFKLICDPAMFEAKGKKKGHFRNTHYERYVKNRALSYLGRAGLTLADFGFQEDSFRRQALPAFFQHNTEYGLEAMCQKLRLRADRTKTLLQMDNFKVLLWGAAIPYKYYMRAMNKNFHFEGLLQEELRTLLDCLFSRHQVRDFWLVGLVVIHGVPTNVTVPDGTCIVSAGMEGCLATMSKVAVCSSLHGAHWKGWHWPHEQSKICSILNSCGDFMSMASDFSEAPSPSVVPCTVLANSAFSGESTPRQRVFRNSQNALRNFRALHQALPVSRLVGGAKKSAKKSAKK